MSSRLLNNTMNFLSNTCKINKMAAVCGLPLRCVISVRRGGEVDKWTVPLDTEVVRTYDVYVAILITAA